VFNAEHLQRILANPAYYNEMRTHVSLGEGCALHEADRAAWRHVAFHDPRHLDGIVVGFAYYWKDV